MFPNQGRCHYVKLFQRYHAIRFHLARDEGNEVDHQGRARIVGHRDQIVKTVVWPVFLEHFLFGDKDNVTTEALAFPNKVATFEIGGETNDVEWASLSFGHVLLIDCRELATDGLI